jgi:hypothetical protein
MEDPQSTASDDASLRKFDQTLSSYLNACQKLEN